MKRKLLFAIVALMCSVGTWAYQTPEANGIYYLYNTACTDGTPGFMSTGNGYGFQVVIDKFGFPVKLIDAGDGKFKFQFIHHEGYLSDNGWMYSDGGGDTDRPRVIEIQDQGSGNYKLYNTNNSTWIEDWYTNVVGDGTENRHNYIWQFLSKAERDAMVAGYTTSVKLAAATSMGMPTSVDTESEFDDYLSTNYIGIDQSSKIQNGTFDTSHNTSGWTTTANNNRNFSIGWGNVDPKTTPEVYEGAGAISQTVSVDKVGLYKVSVNATYRCGNAANNNRIGDLGYDGSVAYLQANNSIAKVSDWYSGKINGNGPNSPSEANSTYFSAGKYLTEVYVYVGDAKTIDISLHSHAFTWSGWLMFNNFKLTYYSDEVSDDDATEILNQAADLEDDIMEASLLSTLTSAKTTFNGARTIANYNALGEAITNAQASIAAYANAKAYLDEAETILAGTNVYTATAYADYYTTPKAKYENRTLTTAEANALVKTSTGWHSVNTIDEILLSSWTIGGQQAQNYDKALYINTWSVEGNNDGSNFLAPFFEYWGDDKQSLGANSLVATVAGLTPNTTYSFTIRARVRQTDNQTKISNGITMQVGSGTPVDISSGAIFGTGPFFIGNFSAVGQTDADGNLVCTITVAANSNISWLSFYNCKYTEGEDLSAYIADYEFAKTTATNASNNDDYAAVTGKEKADLTAALTTYASVDETDKAALISAKEALETATATFVSAAATYNALAELNTTVAAKLNVTLPTITETTTASDLNVEDIIVAEYTAATTNYTLDFTDKLGAWTDAPGNNKSQSWDNTTEDTYYDEYNNAARAMTQTVTLPAGDYAMIAKGRASVNGRLTLVVSEETVTFPHKGASGFGIATDGTATFADNATYANNGSGWGWEYRVMTFTSDGSTPITLTFNWTTANSNWVGLDDIQLFAAASVSTLKAELEETIAEANTLYNNGANVGTGLFQIPESAGTDFYNAISDANDVYEDNDVSMSDITEAISELEAAIDAFKAAEKTPTPGQAYIIRNTTADGALNITTGSVTVGADAAVYFTAVEGGYVLSNASGLYILKTTNNTWTLSTTETKDEAYVLTFTHVDGGYTISGEKGLFGTDARTAGSTVYANKAQANNGVWTISEATTLNMRVAAGKWGTFIAPFDVTIPENVSAYKATGVNNDKVTLEAVETTIPANTPVLLKNDGEDLVEQTFYGISTATEDSYTVGLLTGVYTAATIPASSGNTTNYVLQTQNSTQAFYKVDAAFEATPNRCYLSVTNSQVKAFYFDINVEDGINEVKNGQLSMDNAEIFNLAGQRMNKLQKGVNIVNGKKVLVK